MSFKQEITSGCPTQSTGLRDKRPLTIGMIVMSYYPELCGGAERQCSRLVSELLKRGYYVKILTTRARRDTPVHSAEGCLEIIRLSRLDAFLPKLGLGKKKSDKKEKEMRHISTPDQPRFGKISLLAARTVQFINILIFMAGSVRVLCNLRNEVDIWHMHVASLTAGWCGYVANKLRIPMICKGANLPVFPAEASVPLRQWLTGLRQKLFFVSLTEEMSADLRKNGILESRIAIIPNGIDAADISPRLDPGSDGSVLYVANFTQPVENKAYDILFSSWLLVHRARPSAVLNIAGSGDHAPWSRFLRNNNAEGSVYFLGHIDDLSELYSKASIFVMPSRREGISNALLEAQLAGVPAIVSDIPGNRSVVDDGVTGLILPVDDVESFASAIVDLLDNASRRTEMGRQAHKRIVQNFSIQSVADRYLELYARLGVDVGRC